MPHQRNWNGESSHQFPSYSQHDVELELEPPRIQQQNARLQDDIASDVRKQLPSRDIDRMLDSQQNSNKYGGGFSTLRLRTLNPSVYHELETSQVADIIANDPETNNMELEDIEKLNEEKLRELHYSLSAKRDIKKKLEKNSRKKQKKLSCWKHLKYSWSMKWLHFKSSFRDFFLNFQFWQKPLRIIEGNFGSGVASYFRYLRWLFGMNIFFFCITFLFIVLPQLLTELPTAKLEPHSSCDNVTYTFNIILNNTEKFHGKELITGGDSFKSSYLYYGSYSNKVLSLAKDAYYDIPIAYLLSVGIGLVLVLILTAVVLAKSYKKNYIEHSGFGGSFFANRIFCGWDFAITSEKAANLHSRSLELELKEHLSSLKAKPLIYSLNDRFLKFVRLIVCIVIILAVLCAIGYLMYFFLEKNSLKPNINFLREMSLSLTISAITIIVPSLFTLISKFQYRNAHQSQLRMSMFCSFLLIVLIMGILLYFWLNPRQENLFERADPEISCWETQLGLEIYRLMIVDFFIWVLLYLLFACLKKFVCSKDKKFVGNLEFDVSLHTWNLIYNQVLCWLGTYFCPLIGLIFIIKLFLMFYIKKTTVIYFCQPPSRVWRANRAETVFLAVTFFALILSMVAVGYTVIQHNSSKSCGPFSMLEKPYDVISCITNLFWKDKQWLGLIALFITKPGCVTLFIVFLSCVAYYARAVAKARYKMMHLLRKQVITEGKDKVFLLQMFTSAISSSNRKIDDANQRNLNYRGNSYIDEDSELKTNFPSNDPRMYTTSEIVPELSSPSHSDFFLNQSYSERPQRISESSDQSLQYTNPFNGYKQQAHSSHESISPLTRIEISPKKGAENTAYREDSPFKNKTSPFTDSVFSIPGVSHQQPFQNVGKRGYDRNQYF